MPPKSRTSVQPSNIGRRAYESISAIAWFAAGTIYIALIPVTDFPSKFLLVGSLIMFLLGCWRLFGASVNWRTKARLVLGRPFTTTVDEVLHKQRRARARFLGKGFSWEPLHAGRIHDIHSHPEQSVRRPPSWFERLLIKWGHFLPRDAFSESRYIHGVNASETDLFVPFEILRQHTLILGTNGCGKTRLLEQFVAQDIDRVEDDPSRTRRPGPLIIIDPKGDPGLLDRAHSLAKRTGRERDFHYFSPSSPESSIRFDPLGSFSHATQIADAIRSLLPSGGESEVFAGFAWRAVYIACWAVQKSGQRVSLARLKAILHSGFESIVMERLESHFASLADKYPHWESTVDTQQGRTRSIHANGNARSRRVSALIAYYETQLAFEDRCSDLTSAIGLLREDPVHLKKLITNLFPLLDTLTSGPLARLLSPSEYPDDSRPSLTFQNVLDRSSIVVFNLEALLDSTVAHALGALLIADLVRCAAKRQLHGISYPPIHFVVDEAAEMMSEPFIQAMNKGRSVGLELTVAAQTLPDFEAGLGSIARAHQVLGNFNTLICMRIRDPSTIEFVSDLCGKTVFESRQKSRSVAHRHATGRSSAGTDSTSISSQPETIPMVDKQLLSRLPPGEFFCYRSGGTVLKGRTLLMEIDEDERFPVAGPFEDLKLEA